MSSFTETEGWNNHDWQLFDSEFFPRTKQFFDFGIFKLVIL
jgi:hypothetical protein